tara:strand:+ start:563 stop:3163 length:2601 start_codon:yes stop_codon:yes gene_type:complete
MKNYLLRFIDFLLLSSFIFAANINVNVFDASSKEPIEKANIILKLNNIEISGSSTDINGDCIFRADYDGRYMLIIRHIGYSTIIEDFDVKVNEKYDFTFPLLLESILVPELSIISDIYSPYKDLAGAASVISKSAIKKIDPVGTQEILEHIPGIYGFADDGIGNSRISVGIRGLYPRRSSRVLILEDGIPIQPALYVYPNMYYNPPSERIDGVEVIKGSGVVKYGPQTMGGVINYYTSRPRNEFGGFIKLTAGENGYQSAFAEVSGFGSSNIKNAVQLLYKAGNGFRDNNDFYQFNGTFKSSYNVSAKKNIYAKLGINYENSNATYTGLTEYSFSKDPTFNPKEDDNFKIIRTSFDIIETHQINKDVKRSRKLFMSYFDRRWWREDDVFVSESNPDNTDLHEVIFSSTSTLQYYDDIIRTGNGQSNFGIIRTFYVMGYEDLYKFKTNIFNKLSSTDFGYRLYWERFLDDKVIGDAPDARAGVYYYEADEFTDLDGNEVYDTNEPYIDNNPTPGYDADLQVVGQSHNYETAALSIFISNSINVKPKLILNTGLRMELFEQERVDRLNGASYLDKTSVELLPSFGFIKEFHKFSIFGGIHRGYTSPSSGSIKASNVVYDSGLDLKPEKSWNKEIGVRTLNPTNETNLEFSIFHLDIQDMVAAGRGGKDFGNFQNHGKIQTWGTETNLFFNLDKYLLFLPDVNLTHSYLRTKTVEVVTNEYSFMPSSTPDTLVGNSLPYSPEHTFNIGLEKTIFTNLTVRYDFKYVGKVYTELHNIGLLDVYPDSYGQTVGFGKIGIDGAIPSYNTSNISIGLKLSNKIDLNIIAKNIFDNIYIGSRLHSNPGQREANISSGIIPGPRRQINLNLKYQF